MTSSHRLLDAENVVLSLSGLDQSDLCWIRRLLRALGRHWDFFLNLTLHGPAGITLAQNFSRRSTHLLCPTGNGAKFDKALEWRIPVVSMEWLNYMARVGAIPDVREYLVAVLKNDFVVGGHCEGSGNDVQMADEPAGETNLFRRNQPSQ